MISQVKLEDAMNRLGYNDAHRGTHFLRTAVALAEEAGEGCVAQNVYAEVARRARTTPRAVERAIRTATEAAFNATGWEPGYDVFGNCIAVKLKATNKTVIARLARICRAD